MAIEQVSPANARPKITAETRLVGGGARQKLSAVEIPGYVLHWGLGTAERMEELYLRGYEFVSSEETAVVQDALGGDASHHGSTDMGTRVSKIAGGLGDDGQPLRLYLMKIKEEWYKQDMLVQQEGSEALRRALNSGKVGAEKDEKSSDTANRYVGSASTQNMFQPKPIRRV